MADFIIILVLVGLAALALRSCLRGKKGGDCPGNCGRCGCNCHRKDDDK